MTFSPLRPLQQGAVIRRKARAILERFVGIDLFMREIRLAGVFPGCPENSGQIIMLLQPRPRSLADATQDADFFQRNSDRNRFQISRKTASPARHPFQAAHKSGRPRRGVIASDCACRQRSNLCMVAR